MSARLTFDEVRGYFEGRRVVIVGSGPGVMDNGPGVVDSYDVVVRVNNYKLSVAAGFRTDVHYSFYGNSVKKTRQELIADGVRLCMCKCPDSQPIESQWHRDNQKMNGVDFTYIYRARQGWWPAPVFIPDDAHFLRGFELLDRHIPTTGFSAILDITACAPAELFLTGFDFFTSGIHNVDEPWRAGLPDDPIGHRPDLERAWITGNAGWLGIFADKRLSDILSATAGPT